MNTKLNGFNLAECQRQTHLYQQNLFDQDAIAYLRQCRQQVADAWLSAIDPLEHHYTGELGQIHRLLLNSGIRQEPLTAVEQTYCNDLITLIEAETTIDQALPDQALPRLLAAMLYCRADRLPLLSDPDRLPQWFWSGYLGFRLESPRFFQKKGEVEHYCRYVQQWISVLHQGIFSQPESEFWQYAASHFTQNARLIPLYFSTANLKQVYIQRAEIMASALTLQGYELDFVFPSRSIEPIDSPEQTQLGALATPQQRPKIRLGILNSHFNAHTETFLTLPAFEYLDRTQFKIILYAVTSSGDRLERYCQSRVDRFVVLPDLLSQQVELIRGDHLDLLLLGGNTTAVPNPICLLALHRLARMQMTLYASPVTTGMRNVDYYISGQLTEPPEHAQDHYREQLITLEGTGYCLNYGSNLESGDRESDRLASAPDREKLGIPVEAVVFVSGANFHKIIPELRVTWAKILAALPNSVLMLYPFSPSWSSSYAKQALMSSFQQIFSDNGVNHNRLLLLDCIPHAEVKTYLQLGDVYLDSFPYTGSLSTADPLEVGLPTVVMEGATLRSRQGAALLRELQIFDLIVTDETAYIDLAIALGQHSALRQQKQQEIQQKMQGNPGFFDSRRYSAQIEAVLQEAWANYQERTLVQDFRLSKRNLVVFPDWSQSEDLFGELVNLFRTVLTHADRHQITLLLDTTGTDEASADETIASVILHLLTEEELEITDQGPQITLLTDQGEPDWERLRPRLQARVALTCENYQAIASAQVADLPVYRLDQI
jgi:predicted O-linked N-acetylglucosamine transferase (SPINDLY family)